ncbi:MAG: SH3 domain-containing protein [Anaerolineae bacterium]|nr:SH3 domain-containing protein [Anaerolineae bacterium]
MKSQPHLSSRFSIWLAIGVSILAVLACNLGVAPVTPTPRVSPTSSVKPIVSIQAPQNNADAVVGQAITVQAAGSHPDGVTRLELRANGQQVDSKVSQNPAGDQQFSAYLNYTPITPGTLVLQVLAYRGNTASDPTAITVNVKSQAAQVTATVDEPSVPVVPADPTCRARVEVNGLNFRQGPGQNYPPLQVLSLGTTFVITGRVSDNTWWQGQIGNTRGWVSRSFVTLYGANCAVIGVVQPPASPFPTATITLSPAPTVAQATVTPGKPDLIVTAIDGPVTIILDQNNTKTATYKVSVQNVGSVQTGSFNVGLVLPDGTLRDMGTVPALAAGQTAILQTDVTFNAPGSVRLTAVVDTANTVDETNETNNLKSLDVVLIKPTPLPTTPTKETSQ